jgi:IS30 family transposase
MRSEARGVLKKELMDHLRPKRRMRRSRHATVSGQSRGQIVDAISIRERPAEVEDRAIPGHWEGDLLSGAKNSYIATLVERHSRFAMLIRVRSKETEVVVAALSRHDLPGIELSISNSSVMDVSQAVCARYLRSKR